MKNDSGAILNWTGVLQPATSELTDSEIVHRYSDLFGVAVSAFRQDPSYIVEMAETAAKIQARRNGRAA